VAVSASTLAEDVRQLAHWCRSADKAREQQEGRLDQLERVPPLQAQLKALQDRVSSLLHVTPLTAAQQHGRSFVCWTSAVESCRTAWQDDLLGMLASPAMLASGLISLISLIPPPLEPRPKVMLAVPHCSVAMTPAVMKQHTDAACF